MHAESGKGTTPLLQTVTTEAVRLIPGAESASVTLIRKKRLVDTAGATTNDAREFDRLQQQCGMGPCVDADAEVVEVSDFATERRWGAFTSLVVAHTMIRSCVSYRLFTHLEELGALNVFATAADAFTPDAVEIGYAFSAHVALVFDAARRQEQFSSALASRDIIGQAKGVIMERFDVGATHAFTLLTKLSQDNNLPVAELAHQLVETDHPDGKPVS